MRAGQRGLAEGARRAGSLRHERGDLLGAEEAYALADNLGDAHASLNLGTLRMNRGDFAAAVGPLRRALENDESAAYNLGAALYRSGQAGEAEAVLRAADERGDARCAFSLGTILHGRGEHEEAAQAFARAFDRGYRPPA